MGKGSKLLLWIITILFAFVFAGGIIYPFYWFLNLPANLLNLSLGYLLVIACSFSFFYKVLAKFLANQYATLLVTGIALIVLALLLFAFGSSQAPHHNHDASNHVLMIQDLLRNETKFAEIPLAIRQSFYLGFAFDWYPKGFHYNAAIICQLISDKACYLTPWRLAWLYASLAVFVIYLLAKVYTQSESVALFSALILTTFYLFPYMPFGWGGWAQIQGLTMLGFSLFLLRHFLTGNSIWALWALTLSSISLFYTHTTDFLSFAILGIFLNLDLIAKREFWLGIKRNYWKLLFYILVTGAFILPGYLKGASVPRFETAPDLPFNFSAAISFLSYHLFNYTGNTALYFAFVLGLLFLLAINRELQKHYLPFVLTFLFLSILVTGLRYFSLFNTQLFGGFYPWGQPERILYLHYLTVPIIAGFFYSEVFKRLKQFPAIVVLFTIILISLYGKIYSTTINQMQRLNTTYSTLTQSDLNAFQHINKHQKKYQAGYFFIDPYNSSGAWLDELTEAKSYFAFVSSILVTKTGNQFLNVFIRNYQKEITRARLCKTLKSYQIKFIFLGAKHIPNLQTYIPEALQDYSCLKLDEEFGLTRIYEVI